MTGPLRITSTDGLTLEAILDAPAEPAAALVLCHPHPQMGGTMDAPLLVALTEDMKRRNWAVLRFNFRGIGTSEGMPGTGHDEVADAAGALAELRRRYEVPVALAGWSFGGAVAIRAAGADGAVVATAGIAPAITEKPGITDGLPPGGDIDIKGRLLVVVGANDDLVDPTEAAEWARAANATFVEMQGANHFFWAKYDALAELVGDFLDESV